jgi:hypothetical protein
MLMINFIYIITLLICIIPSMCLSQEFDDYNDVINSISAQNIKRHMDFLASDIFEGRGTGTTGGNLAAKYIALEYSKYGLQPIGDANTFYQYVPMHGSNALPSSELKLFFGEDETRLKLKSDYLLYKTGQQTYIPIPLQLVFVGYGIIAPEFDYNDYHSTDVEGKIVVMLSGEPESDDMDYFEGDIPTVYTYPQSKQRLAISRGAAGSIIIPTDKNFDWEEQKKEFAFEDVTLAYSVSSNLSILFNPEIADEIFEGADYSFSDVLDMQKEKRLTSFPLTTQISFKGNFKRRDFLSSNITGMIEGSNQDLKDSYLIISAHYDHLGIGKPVEGDSIYNGALDNAIGVSCLLELAKSFSILESPPKRSIIFLAVTGEEKGLLGSSYYTDHPLVPLHKTIANINIDGIAMFKDFESVVGIGTEYSNIGNFFDSSAAKFNISVQEIPQQFKHFEAFNRSDQISFALAGIPSILILEGVKNKNKSEEEILTEFINYMTQNYHSPFDDLNQNIDYEAAMQHAKILFDFSYLMTNSDSTPEWHQGVPFINARLQSIAERK